MTLLSIVSGFVWELPQSIIGGLFSLFRRRGSEVSSYRGTTVILRRESVPFYWGVSLGSFINVGGNADDFRLPSVLAHEFGHTLQSRILGPLYLLVVGFPSLIGCRLPLHDHRCEWYEVWANRLSYRYHVKHGREMTAARWNRFEYPLAYRLDWYSIPTFLYYSALIALVLTLVL